MHSASPAALPPWWPQVRSPSSWHDAGSRLTPEPDHPDVREGRDRKVPAFTYVWASAHRLAGPALRRCQRLLRPQQVVQPAPGGACAAGGPRPARAGPGGEPLTAAVCDRRGGHGRPSRLRRLRGAGPRLRRLAPAWPVGVRAVVRVAVGLLACQVVEHDAQHAGADGLEGVHRLGQLGPVQLAEAMDSLEAVGARVLGIVLNHLARKQTDSYAYYGPDSDRPGRRKTSQARSGATKSAKPGRPAMPAPSIAHSSRQRLPARPSTRGPRPTDGAGTPGGGLDDLLGPEQPLAPPKRWPGEPMG